MRLRNRIAERNRRIALKAWLKEQDAWDGKAYATDPWDGSLVDLDAYGRGYCRPVMQAIDKMTPEYRALVHEFQDFDAIWAGGEMRRPPAETRDLLSQ